ncbi:hypothetical protein I3F58_11840 [Streptomyces sp. MUM 203J]|uniref:hypothetical protein n=1 Tax=Streptomyces sp. MUM 203J TaxID=2791990 RepID=UPI001F03F0F8|nr:hypothetical protein [Streptomyces sp. MUM 203J]MCH0540248.1 hypothetical protein [Streptomyces sp. MUM 203J]
MDGFQYLKGSRAPPGMPARAGAMTNDAVNAVQPMGEPYLIRPASGGCGSLGSAVGHAAYGC